MDTFMDTPIIHYQVRATTWKVSKHLKNLSNTVNQVGLGHSYEILSSIMAANTSQVHKEHILDNPYITLHSKSELIYKS